MSRSKNQETIRFAAMPEARDVPVIIDRKPTYATSTYVPYGRDNKFPDYLSALNINSPLMSAITRTMKDFVFGNGVEFSNDVLTKLIGNNKRNLNLLVKNLVADKVLYDAFAIKLTYNRKGEIAKISHVDIRDLRLNLEGDTAYYSKYWGQGSRQDVVEYKTYEHFTFGEDGYECIVYDKGDARGVYAIPSYVGALRAIETSIEIQKFHFASIQNNLAAASIININDADSYTEEEKQQVEKKIKENFCGASNGSQVMVAFNSTADNQVTISRLQDETYDQKYQSLNESTTKAIFTAFRMQSILCGFLAENIGFNSQEYAESFAVYQQTVISPIQDHIKDAFDGIFGEGSITFKEFNLNLPQQKTNPVAE